MKLYEAGRWSKRQKLFDTLSQPIKYMYSSLEKVLAADSADEYDASWKLKNRQFPYSCTDEEGIIMYYVITSNRLKRGFEIATAFGFSSIYIGLALNKVGGHLVTMDCYVEEWKESFLYEPEELTASIERVRQQISRNVLPIGLSLAKHHAEKLGLSKVIDFQIGISPQDIPAALKGRKIDFAYIDGGHFGDQPTQDFLALYPYLSEKCAVFFHDNDGTSDSESVQNAVTEAERLLGVSGKRLSTRYSLTLLGRGLDETTLKTLDYLSMRTLITLKMMRPLSRAKRIVARALVRIGLHRFLVRAKN